MRPTKPAARPDSPPQAIRRILAAGRLSGWCALFLLQLLVLGLVVNPQSMRRPPQGLTSPTTPASPQVPALGIPFLGITVQMDHLPPDQMAARMADLKADGFGWVRQRADWAQIEPQPDQFAWSATDNFVVAATAHGLTPVLVLDGSPAWARDQIDRDRADNPFAPPQEFAAFARFAASVAARYAGRVRFYQLWDEPNIAPHWGNRLIDPVGYARLLAAAAPAIRAQDADAQILLAALAPTTDHGHTAIDEITYLRRLYAAGAADHFDILALQPFGFGRSPQDPPRADLLNLRRAELVHQVMVDAGDGQTPVWAVRAGWNVRLFAPWGTVTPANQQRFAAQALALAWADWPWLSALGWAIDQPTTGAANPMWGFALSTPDGADTPIRATLSAWAEQTSAAPRPAPSSQPGRSSPIVLLLLAGLLLAGWRGWAAAKQLPWSGWAHTAARLPRWQHMLLWAGLLTIYYFATWPPLILACWLLAGLGFWVQPRLALYFAGVLLPFHFFHKEMTLPLGTLVVPPSYAALVLGLPGLIRLGAAGGQPSKPRFIAGTDGLALAWLGIGLLGLGAGWPWSAYGQGLLEIVLVPLALYATTRGALAAVRPVSQQQGLAARIVAAAALGGVLAALVGLWARGSGGGTLADGVRRLTAPTFSPNHTALYLERSFFLLLALALASRQRAYRLLWAGGGTIVLAALALTASRGAWLLGLPAGGLTFLLVFRGERVWRARTWRRLAIWGGALGSLGGGGAIVLGGERLANSATVFGRILLWQNSLALWRDHLWFGVGPGLFTWRYPAYVTAQTANEPNLLHPHNLWLEMATTGGVLALVWMVAALAITWRLMRRIRQDQGHADRKMSWQGSAVPALTAGLAAGLVAGVAHAQVDAFAALADLAAWNWLALGVLAGLADAPKAER